VVKLGKSSYAENLAKLADTNVCGDSENGMMTSRIDRHQNDRDDERWINIEKKST
jgi:adenosyl cobinamide kinase/adenosyl cobinamide phosphate guanylyltransferase